MRTYLIGYDLNKQGQNYHQLIEEIKNIGNWWHCLGSTFIVKSNSSVVEIRDYLNKFIDSNDELLVARLTGEAAWVNFEKNCLEWLNNNLSYD